MSTFAPKEFTTVYFIIVSEVRTEAMSAVGLVYTAEADSAHAPPVDGLGREREHMERPERTQVVWERLVSSGLAARCQMVDARHGGALRRARRAGERAFAAGRRLVRRAEWRHAERLVKGGTRHVPLARHA